MPNASAITAVFFDIDGTLLDMHGAGRAAFGAALAQALQWDFPLEQIQFAGNTDFNILRQVAAHRQQRLAPAQRRRFFAALARALTAHALPGATRAYPGAGRLVRTLARMPGVRLGLITGNARACAEIKLRQIGLHRKFRCGAYGDEEADRRRIARLAMRRLRAAAGGKPRACFLIGDTPNDIAAAHDIGATAIAVATGRFTTAELRAAGAQWAVENLEDTRQLLRWMGLVDGADRIATSNAEHRTSNTEVRMANIRKTRI